MNIKELIKSANPAIIIAATKTRTADEIKRTVNEGIDHIGENWVQEAGQKYSELSQFFKAKNVKFHMLGKLQKNKVKKAVAMFDMIQSVDSIALACEIDKYAALIDKVQEILIEVNIGEEVQKSGLNKKEVHEALVKMRSLKNIRVMGLMAIPPYSNKPELSRPYFREMRKIYEKEKTMDFKYLSLGMSSDYKVAIEEGATMIRLGTLLFGKRK